ncbi:MAG: hypothetical protein VZR95_02655 [Alphaproteobacteria bacterium]|jgi:hypothetical protein
MRKIISTFIFAALLLSVNPAQATQFIDGMDDVPLPDGMTQITQDDFSFGNEETRLLEAHLTEIRSKNAPKIKFAKISEFYQESLPQLGWIYQGNRGNDLLFYRDGETLEVVRESVSPLIVRVTVKTKP